MNRTEFQQAIVDGMKKGTPAICTYHPVYNASTKELLLAKLDTWGYNYATFKYFDIDGNEQPTPKGNLNYHVIKDTKPYGDYKVICSVDGMDGVGKSTTIEGLEKFIRRNGVAVQYTKFPRYETAIGKLIKRFLSGEEGISDTHPDVMAHLYAADRLDWTNRDQYGCVSICDRYSFSNVFIQAQRFETMEERQKAMNDYAFMEHDSVEGMGNPKPHCAIVLYGDPDILHGSMINREDNDSGLSQPDTLESLEIQWRAFETIQAMSRGEIKVNFMDKSYHFIRVTEPVLGRHDKAYILFQAIKAYFK